jgi:hypothetical protein
LLQAVAAEVQEVAMITAIQTVALVLVVTLMHHLIFLKAHTHSTLAAVAETAMVATQLDLVTQHMVVVEAAVLTTNQVQLADQVAAALLTAAEAVELLNQV